MTERGKHHTIEEWLQQVLHEVLPPGLPSSTVPSQSLSAPSHTSAEAGVVCWHEGMPPEQIVTPALQTPGSPVVQALVPAAQMPRSPLELLHRVQRIESGAHWGVGHTGGLDQNSA